jgi:hypothetical protein
MESQMSRSHLTASLPDLIPATATQVANCLKLLLGCYRTVEAHDPDTFASSLLRAMSGYPLDVLMAAIDPAIGLPSKLKWPPQPAEIKQFCDAIMAPRWREAERRRRTSEQIEARAELRKDRPHKSYEQLCEEFAQVGIFIGCKHDMRAKEVVAADLMARHCLSQAEWDAIPDAPKFGGASTLRAA